MNWIRTETFKIRGYEIGPDQRVPLGNICGYMEEAAALHAAELGFSVEELARRGLAWAVIRTWLEFEASPWLGGRVLDDEESSLVRVTTWPVAAERLQYRRDFLITWKGRTLARAVTDWVVINLQSRRAERIPEFITALQPENPQYVLEAGRLRLPEQRQAPLLASFTVRRADIDRNNHVNNARFAEWLAESVPGQGPETDSGSDGPAAEADPAPRLKVLQILYKAEGRYGDTVEARGAGNGAGEWLIGLHRRSDGQELVRARGLWARPAQAAGL